MMLDQVTPQVENERQRMLADLAIRQAVAQKSDELFEPAKEPAERLWDAFGPEEVGMAQVRNFENIAYTTDRLSDIFDFLKRQMGRTSKLGEHWQHKGVGASLLRTLQALGKEARIIVEPIKVDYPLGVSEDTARQVHLALCREFIKHLAAHFLYTRATRAKGRAES